MQIESITGAIPAGTTEFKVMLREPKEGGGVKWVACFAQSEEGGDAKTSTFKIEVLDLESIREAWGPGAYQLIFFAPNGDKLIRTGRSRVFELTKARTSRARAPAPPSPAPAPVPPSSTSEAFGMIQMASTLAAGQVAMMQSMAQQQVAFMQEHSRISQEQMSQHYAAMLRTQRTNDGPIVAALREMRRDINELQQYEPEPVQLPAGTTPAEGPKPEPGSLEEWIEAGKKYGPRVLEFGAELYEAAQTRKANKPKAAE